MKLKKNWIILLFLAIGGFGGYLYWYFVGCVSGSCPLQKLWYNNVIIGGIIGYLIGDSVNSSILKKTKTEKTNQNQ